MNSAELRRLAVAGALGIALIAVALVVAIVLDEGSGAAPERAGRDSTPAEAAQASDAAAPRIGDHWHAPYHVSACGRAQPAIAEFAHSSGIHTHADGIIHMHPLTAQGEGSGASVAQFFKNSGGWIDFGLVPEGCTIDYSNPVVLRADSGIHPLGQGFAAAAAVCDAKPGSDFERVSVDYIPQDGDCIRVVFGGPSGR